MQFKEFHTCDRCGNRWLTRHHAFYDEMVEWAHHADCLLAELRQTRAQLELAQTRLAAARERIDQLRDLVNALPDPMPDSPMFADEEPETA